MSSQQTKSFEGKNEQYSSSPSPPPPPPPSRSSSSFSAPFLVAIAAILAVVAAQIIKTAPFSLPAAITGSRLFARLFDTSASSSGTGAGAGQTVSPAIGSTTSSLSGTGVLNSSTMAGRTPVYFWGHGGPNIMYEYDHPAYSAIQKLGKEITTQVKPKAVVVLSGHWQGKKDEVLVNTAEKTDLIYDFYGFPSHYYKEKYPSVGSKEVAEKVIDTIRAAGLKISGVKRGLDHGVWTSFKIAFDQEENPLNVPVVQLSLYGNEDPAAHFKLGTALAPLRDQNIVIISSGMAVHNIRDYMFATSAKPLPYTTSFDEAMKEAAGMPFGDGEREKAVVDLVKRLDARPSHPYMDHLMPFHVAAGAAVEDQGKQVFTFLESSMSWAQYRWGNIPVKQ